MKSQRAIDAAEICAAYESVEEGLRRVGKLLRTTEVGRYLWARDHKAAVTGLRVIVKQLRRDVPSYDGDITS